MVYEKIVCLEHPVFLNERMNFISRERVIAGYLEGYGRRVAGGAGEFLDHQNFRTAMDMPFPLAEIRPLTRPRPMMEL
jgi:hypothetical protein